MTTRSSLGHLLPSAFVLALVGASFLSASGSPHPQSGETAAAASPSASGLQGTWSGTFTSKDAQTPPFTMTVVIGKDTRGRIVGNASLVSQCLKSHHLQVTMNGSKVVLSGSDADGDNITFTGTVDGTGTMLTLNYILNGSASRRCETDNGTGTLGKR